MAVVFSQDYGGSTRCIVQQRKLPKVLPLMQCSYQALCTRSTFSITSHQQYTDDFFMTILKVFVRSVIRFTFPCVITFTEPFQMMYQDVPLSP